MTRPTELNYVTCPYGKPGSWMAGYHTGIDYRAAVGTEIFATRRGKVVHAGPNSSYGDAYGTCVIIQTFHRGRVRQHLYAHLSKVKVRKGQKVSAGEVVGLGGETGNTFGPHLHYEERTRPFSYWNHYRPILPAWQPKKPKVLQRILKRIGIRD